VRQALAVMVRHNHLRSWSITVNRSRLVLDIIAQMGKLTEPCSISVTFQDEPGIDCGGVRREFFQLGARDLFSPDYSMFKLVNGGLYWFTENSFESMESYEAIGRFVGPAGINGIPLPVRRPRLLYKKLLGIPLTLTDIGELDADLARSLVQMREYRDDGQDVADLALTFSVSIEQFGQTDDIPFFEGGERVDVTNERLDEFLRLRTEFLLDGSVRPQFEAFQRGFRTCCGHHLFQKFTPDELDMLVSGEAEYNWQDLKAGARYRGYSPS
jgi:hypothetical protein